MFHARSLLILPIAGGSLLLTGFFVPAPRPSSPQSSISSASAEANPEVVRLLQQAVEKLEPGRVIWMETNIWQKVTVQGLDYQAEGHYLTAPERRFRLEMATRVGSADAQLRVVCDGARVWQSARSAGDDWTWSPVVNLRALAAAPDSAVAELFPGDAFLQNHFRGGIHWWLRELQAHMVWVSKDEVRRQDRLLTKLTGVLSTTSAEALAPAKEKWPAGLPRAARLYLDPQTLWPHRMEWWGPDPPRSGEVLLMQMEFRDPVINHALPAERCAREFANPR